MKNNIDVPDLSPTGCTVIFTYLPDTDDSFPVAVKLVWDPRDPLAVRLGFAHGNWWAVGRDLLEEGLSTDDTAGLGDVRIYPDRVFDDSVIIEFDSPDGWAVFRAPRDQLKEFLAATSRPGVDPMVELDAWLEREVPAVSPNVSVPSLNVAGIGIGIALMLAGVTLWMFRD